ncbi:relaxase/mobilization nuclease domain-containing protein [Flavobacterium sp. FlaQc-57]|uniref:relaxase/mobilization nuclease domain-containing protein n=1 Tax=Flavobacterium sp. FlaQc-57 TaxID=3374186 RepID=UPI00375649E0
MVAVINTGHSIRGIITYNENKVSQGEALCIGEGNYPVDIQKMSTAFKLNLLLKQLELNENVTRSSVHISLNFDPSENALTKEKLMQIAASYMQKIRFGQQPYLVYQHFDAAHPHIHIVTIKVKADGSRIDMHNIGRNQSETARKEIEKTFNLVCADSRKNLRNTPIVFIDIEKIKYGTVDSKRAISRVLNAVVPHYRYTTIGELNAVLNLYNIRAEQGKENSKMYQSKGLIYQILDQQKRPIGVPIKASSFYSKPTLAQLEINFVANKSSRTPHMKRVKNAVDLLLLKNPKIKLSELESRLVKKGIAMCIRTNEQDMVYGITYVDHLTKCVFNGSSLGTAYAAKGLQERLGTTGLSVPKLQSISLNQTAKHSKSFISVYELQRIIDNALQPDIVSQYIPNQLKNKRKKRKRKGQSDNQ